MERHQTAVEGEALRAARAERSVDWARAVHGADAGRAEGEVRELWDVVAKGPTPEVKEAQQQLQRDVYRVVFARAGNATLVAAFVSRANSPTKPCFGPMAIESPNRSALLLRNAYRVILGAKPGQHFASPLTCFARARVSVLHLFQYLDKIELRKFKMVARAST